MKEHDHSIDAEVHRVDQSKRALICDDVAQSEIFPHLDERGHARMVDVTAKPPTSRRAVARGRVVMAAATAASLAEATGPLRDALGVARTAGVFAAKRAFELLPLCHPILIGDVSVEIELLEGSANLTASVEALDRTGVEMEALTACVVAALSLYERCKDTDGSMSIEDVTVWEKSGGRSGTWERRKDGTVDHVAPGQPVG